LEVEGLGIIDVCGLTATSGATSTLVPPGSG